VYQSNLSKPISLLADFLHQWFERKRMSLSRSAGRTSPTLTFHSLGRHAVLYVLVARTQSQTADHHESRSTSSRGQHECADARISAVVAHGATQPERPDCSTSDETLYFHYTGHNTGGTAGRVGEPPDVPCARAKAALESLCRAEKWSDLPNAQCFFRTTWFL